MGVNDETDAASDTVYAVENVLVGHGWEAPSFCSRPVCTQKNGA
jgi:hypothetical protein